jgi:hypothetical protein
MHGVKSHSFDNFPSFCFSFSSCRLFVELAKNIRNVAQGVMAHWCSPLWDPQPFAKGPRIKPNVMQVIVFLFFVFQKKEVWPLPLAQMLPCPQLIFPSKTWFFGIYLNFHQ